MLCKERMISELKISHSTNENEIKSGFDPALRDIKSRYVSLEDALIKIVKALKWNILKDGKVLYNLEILFLSMDDVENAKYVNDLRNKTRLVKNIVLNSKMKERSKYQLSDNEDLVDRTQLYLKRLVVKIIAIVLNIFMNTCKNTILI